MRLKQYILNEGRSQIISEDEAMNIIHNKCSDSIKKDATPIYRGIRNNHDYMFVDPKKGEPRISANTKNYYTLLNDHSHYWKEYPKRSRSIICTTDMDMSNNYGWVYRVYPYNGSKIGVCPANDYWVSFKSVLKLLPSNVFDMDEFNEYLEDFIRKKLNVMISDNSYKELEHDLKMASIMLNDKPKTDSIWNLEFLKGYDGDLLKYLQKLMAPKPNGFKLKKSGDKLPKDKEVWTDGKSVLIRVK